MLLAGASLPQSHHRAERTKRKLQENQGNWNWTERESDGRRNKFALFTNYYSVEQENLSWIRLVTIPVCDRGTNGRTDGRNFYGNRAPQS